MDETEAFKQLFSEDLAGFSWHVSPTDLPDAATCSTVLDRLHDWWAPLSDQHKALLDTVDLSDAFWHAGMFNEWPGLYSLVHGLPFGDYRNTMNNIVQSYNNAKNRAPDKAAQSAVGEGIQGVIGNN